MRRACVLAAMALCGAAPAFAQGNAPVRSIIVDRPAFECLIRNIDKVPSEPRGVFVDFSDCQRDRDIKVIRHLITPAVPPKADGAEYVLFVKPRQLKCLKANRKRIDRLLKPAAGNRYGLKLDPCGR